MSIEQLQDLLFWSLVINSAIYFLTAAAVQLMGNFICKVHKRMFAMEDAETLKAVQHYLANYKLLITVFNFTPWVALLIIGS